MTEQLALQSTLRECRDIQRHERFALSRAVLVDGFGDQPEVINGFSELFVVAFGESGKGARAAVGMSSLPRNIPVEISAIVELHE